MVSVSERITAGLVTRIRDRVEANAGVHRALPGGGRIHVDQQLPFLIVYRRPPGREDPDTDLFVRGEASHLTVSGARSHAAGVAALVDGIVGVLSDSFGGVLLIELWAARDEPNAEQRPLEFRVLRARGDNLSSTSNVLEAALAEVKIKGNFATVEATVGRAPAPPGMVPLMSAARARELNCHLMGIEVPPVYRDIEHDDAFPIVRRALHRGVSRAVQKSVFEFTRRRTSHRPAHYRALGRRSFVKALWDVDEQLATIASSFDFVLQVTPVNIEEAWAGFRRSRFQSLPDFTSRPLRLDPAIAKRDLFKIRLERIEDPTLAELLRSQQSEIDRKLTMLSDRGTNRFLYGSMQVFGGVDDALLDTALTILQRVPRRSRDESLRDSVNASEFAVLAERELDHYRAQYAGVASRVEIRRDIAALTVSSGNLLIPAQLKVPHSRVDALLAHEVGTHVLTFANGRAQRFRQLYVGLPGYEELQEGMAVLAEYLAGGLSRPRLRLLAARVVATRRLIEGASFIEVFRELDREFGFTQRTAFGIATRVFRGGGLTKDAMYLRGLVGMTEFLRKGGEYERLLVGKFGPAHIPLIEELRWRKMLVDTPLRPRYLDDTQGLERLARVRNGASLLDMVGIRKGGHA